MDAWSWRARAVAAALASHYQRQTSCGLTEATKRALVAWPRRGLPVPSIGTLLAYRRYFERRGFGHRGRSRSAAEDEAATYYSALCAFLAEDAGSETTVLRRLLAEYAADKIHPTTNR